MAKAEELHRSLFKALPAHTDKSGCIVRCESNYVENRQHSHRWQAAEKARGRPDVYGPLDKGRWFTKPAAVVEMLAKRGIVATSKAVANAKVAFETKPFVRAYSPWPHNAHHIIPMSALWNEVIEKALAKTPNHRIRMLNILMRGVLTEPYNHNGEPNMILLPTADKEARKFGLPKHLEIKEQNHPRYSSLVGIYIKSVHTKYDGVAKDLKAGKHEKEIAPPRIRPPLEDISDAVYDALIAVAKANQGIVQTLESSIEALATNLSVSAAK